jgi:hypothetical protein
MVPFAFIFAPLLFAVVVSSSPHESRSHSSRSVLCGPLVITPIGIAEGTIPVNGISQFPVKYASAQRWQNPVVMGLWELPYASSIQ